jgi:hypothetical protein
MKPTPQAIKDSTRELGPLNLRAAFDPTTINKDERTVEVVASTENAVRIRNYVDWEGSEYVDEILSHNPKHVRMERINAGAPCLNNHYRYDGVNGVLGVIVKAWISGGQMRALIKFSKREDVEPVWQDVIDGILIGISVGYRVYEYEITRKEGAIDIYRAIDWEPFEISFAPVQADIKSGVRNADGTADKTVSNSVKISLAAPATENRNANLNPHKVEENTQTAGGANPAGTDAQRAAAGQQTTQPVNTAELQRQAIEGERSRVKDITAAVRAAGLEQSFADTLVSEGHDINKARELIIAEFAKKDPANGQRSQQSVRTGADETDKRREAMELAIVHRSTPSAVKAEAMKGNEYRGLSLLRMAEACIVANGGNARGLSNSELAREALNIRSGGMSTSDFPIILGNTVNRRLQSEYQLAAPTFQEWASRGTVTDFKEVTRAYMTELGDMKEIKEGGEYKAVTLGEGAEKYKVAKYGNKIIITWETLVNDDLSAFSRLPGMIAQTARRKQSDIVYAILSANANMGDGVALFHASHGNLMTAAAISDVSLAEGRKLMRVQKGKGGKDFLNLMPSFLIVGPEKETEALKYTSADYLPNTQSQINPWKNFQIVVEPRVTGNVWYLACKPGIVDTVEYSFLDGEELTVESRNGFDVDGVETKARMVFGAKALDWKGLSKNAGN